MKCPAERREVLTRVLDAAFFALIMFRE